MKRGSWAEQGLGCGPDGTWTEKPLSLFGIRPLCHSDHRIPRFALTISGITCPVIEVIHSLSLISSNGYQAGDTDAARKPIPDT